MHLEMFSKLQPWQKGKFIRLIQVQNNLDENKQRLVFLDQAVPIVKYLLVSHFKFVTSLHLTKVGGIIGLWTANESTLNLRNLSKTRWVARSESIDAVWRSFEGVTTSLMHIIDHDKPNSKTRVTANAILGKLRSLDFIVCLMFMRIIMRKTKILTVQLQSPDPNISDTMTSIDGTVSSLETLNKDDRAMDAQIQAAVDFAIKVGVDAETEFNRKYRVRRPPRRIDDKTWTRQLHCQFNNSIAKSSKLY